MTYIYSLAVKPKDSKMTANFAKAVGKFTREDPTLRVSVDAKVGIYMSERESADTCIICLLFRR